jgi:hypothetical protein
VKKTAIFVEGMTEQEFVVALVSNLAGSKGVHVALGRQFKGKVTIEPTVPLSSDQFFVLVVDCANDEQVKTQTRDQYPHLISAGYTSIIGLRDVYPLTLSEVGALEAALSIGLPNGKVVPDIHLAVMEIEAWFIAETSHFARIHSSLSPETIVGNGFDIISTAPELWVHPAGIIDSIYRLSGSRYTYSNGKKSRKRVLRTLRALDFGDLCTVIRTKLQRLDRFVGAVEGALV